MNDKVLLVSFLVLGIAVGIAFGGIIYNSFDKPEPCSLTCTIDTKPQPPQKFVSASLILSGETYEG